MLEKVFLADLDKFIHGSEFSAERYKKVVGNLCKTQRKQSLELEKILQSKRQESEDEFNRATAAAAAAPLDSE